MKKDKQYYLVLPPSLLLLLLIIYTEAAVQGAREGITQCIQVIVPSMFPFIFITGWLNSRLPSSLLSPVPLLSMPRGCRALFLTGLLGGYPVGAKTIADAYDNKSITKQTAHILLGYCNNPGPAFIFGISHTLFDSIWIPWLVWTIQILSALVTGIILPKSAETSIRYEADNAFSLASNIKRSIFVTSVICGWIILFKILLRIIAQFRIIESLLPIWAGILELSNGCLILSEIMPLSLRFLLFCVFLSFGGLCVWLQTISVVTSTGPGLFYYGKMIQTAICTLVSIPMSCLLFRKLPFSISTMVPIVLLCIMIILLLSAKCRKTSGNHMDNRV